MNNVNLIFQFTDHQMSLIRDLGDFAKFGPEKLDQYISSNYNLGDLYSLFNVPIPWTVDDSFSNPSSYISFIKWNTESYIPENDYSGCTWIIDDKDRKICDIELTQIGWLIYSKIK